MIILNKTESKIHEAALVLFSSKGFAATSIRDIADEANINSATMYYYFQSKEEILYKIMKIYLDELYESAVSALSETKDSNKQLEVLISSHVKNHGQHRLPALVVDNEFASLKGEFYEEIRGKRKEYEEIWLTVLEKGLEEGVFHCSDSKVTAFALIGLCTGVAQWFHHDGRLTIEEITKIYVELGLKMVRWEQADGAEN